MSNASFLAVHPTNQFLYAVNENAAGSVSAFAIEDKQTGALKLLNYKESKGRGPSYISVDTSGHYVLDANYGGGFVEIHSLAANGSLVFVPGAAGEGRQVVVSVDRQGRPSPLPGLPLDRYRDVRVSPEGQRLALATQDDLWIYSFARESMSK